jgi:2-phosphoglycolate phosphatase
MNPTPRLSAVLFDLDGTLLDTAPDMVAALDALLAEQGHGPVEYAHARLHVSKGAIGLINLAFGALDIDLEEAHRLSLRDRYLELYAQQLCQQTILFDGMADVLARLEAANMHWGIVTNKPGFLAEPLLEQLGLLHRSATLVSGDTLPERKPHPRPLLYAAEQIAVKPDQVVYVGDDTRDIEAGNAAGMTTVAAAYGFIPPDEDPASWRADHLIEHPGDLLTLPGLDTLTQDD